MPTLGTVAASAYDAWCYQDSISTIDGRFALASMVMPQPASALGYRSGVFASGDSGTGTHTGMLVETSSGMNVTVRQGNAIIDTSANGPYMFALDSQKTLALAASSGTQNRYDLIIARVYDDQNSAIGSPAGTRKSVVEVWTGDGSTGTPSVPTPTPTAGWKALSSIYIPKNSSTILAANIADLRGPGIVARGGMRGLYNLDARPGSTAWNEDGSYCGDQRWVHNSVFQHQVFYGSGIGWRGVHNCLVYNANPATTGWIGSFTVGQVTEVCRVHVPYPGTPFMIYPTARSLFQQGPGTSVDLRITLDSYNGSSASGTLVSWTRHDVGNTNANTLQGLNVAPIMYGPFTAATDVVMSHMLWASSAGNTWGYNFGGSANTDNLLSVNVYPSTVQPPTQ